MSGAQGRGGEGISRGGEPLALKWGEIKSSALTHVSWNAHFRAVGGGEWVILSQDCFGYSRFLCDSI